MKAFDFPNIQVLFMFFKINWYDFVFIKSRTGLKTKKNWLS